MDEDSENTELDEMSAEDREEIEGIARVHLEMPVEPIDVDSADAEDLLAWATDAIMSFRAGLLLTHVGHPAGARILVETVAATGDTARELSQRVLAKSLVGDVEAMLREREL